MSLKADVKSCEVKEKIAKDREVEDLSFLPEGATPRMDELSMIIVPRQTIDEINAMGESLGGLSLQEVMNVALRNLKTKIEKMNKQKDGDQTK